MKPILKIFYCKNDTLFVGLQEPSWNNSTIIWFLLYKKIYHL